MDRNLEDVVLELTALHKQIEEIKYAATDVAERAVVVAVYREVTEEVRNSGRKLNKGEVEKMAEDAWKLYRLVAEVGGEV